MKEATVLFAAYFINILFSLWIVAFSICKVLFDLLIGLGLNST